MLGDGEGSSFGAVGIQSDSLVIGGNDGSMKIELVQRIYYIYLKLEIRTVCLIPDPP